MPQHVDEVCKLDEINVVFKSGSSWHDDNLSTILDSPGSSSKGTSGKSNKLSANLAHLHDLSSSQHKLPASNLSHPHDSSSSYSIQIHQKKDVPLVSGNNKSRVGSGSSKSTSHDEIASTWRKPRTHCHAFCDACEAEEGERLVCDRCPASFHLECLDPPLHSDNAPTGVWYCPKCSYEALQKEALPEEEVVQEVAVETKVDSESLMADTAVVKKLFSQLIKTSKSSNPKEFALPKYLRPAIRLPGTYKNAIEKRRKSVIEVQYGSVPVPVRSCFQCQKTCLSAPLIQCDFCPLLFHVDCLEPALSTLPHPDDLWQCPVHLEQLLRTIDSTPQTFDSDSHLMSHEAAYQRQRLSVRTRHYMASNNPRNLVQDIDKFSDFVLMWNMWRSHSTDDCVPTRKKVKLPHGASKSGNKKIPAYVLRQYVQTSQSPRIAMQSPSQNNDVTSMQPTSPTTSSSSVADSVNTAELLKSRVLAELGCTSLDELSFTDDLMQRLSPELIEDLVQERLRSLQCCSPPAEQSLVASAASTGDSPTEFLPSPPRTISSSTEAIRATLTLLDRDADDDMRTSTTFYISRHRVTVGCDPGCEIVLGQNVCSNIAPYHADLHYNSSSQQYEIVCLTVRGCQVDGSVLHGVDSHSLKRRIHSHNNTLDADCTEGRKLSLREQNKLRLAHLQRCEHSVAAVSGWLGESGADATKKSGSSSMCRCSTASLLQTSTQRELQQSRFADSALLRHGSCIRLGCRYFVFSVVYPQEIGWMESVRPQRATSVGM